MKFLLALLALAVSLSVAEKLRFDNFRVYRLIPNDEETLNILKQFEDTEELSEYNFWSPPLKVGGEVDLMVPPYRFDEIENMAKSRGMNASVFIEDVQELIDNEGLRSQSRAGSFGWTSYHTLAEYNNFLRSLATRFPNTVTLLRGGVSHEGREILGVKVSFSPANQNNAVFLESLIHAREWIAGAVNTYILNEIVTSTDPAFRRFAERYDWYVFPVFNPDGFSFSHTNNRMWRKTRVPYTLCFGADPNRNWAYFWNSGGASALPCAETYRGPRAFSEPSTRSLSEFISSIGHRLVAYISFHSFSQMLLIPYGHTRAHLDNYDLTRAIGLRAAASLARRYGTQYVVGNIAETIYIASGGSMDWVKGTFGTPIAYTYELRDRGSFGFLLPAAQIIPSALETLDSLVTILDEYERSKQ
ncbi:zinc carboxypeptidase-like [Anoplophora glabripennis]|uniref:zinc carboxypeptidase-like n=1 Tax=Anoplophora glabripennis TaxID=217634 RepID=UPI0008744657|nr:zinc carboxypeptidase-like [Anoplophora glabripennis]